MRLLTVLPLLVLAVALPLASAQQSETRGKLTERLPNPEGKLTLRLKGQTVAVVILRRGAGNVLEILSARDMKREQTGSWQTTTFSGKVSLRLTQGRDVVMQMNADDVVLEPLAEEG